MQVSLLMSLRTAFSVTVNSSANQPNILNAAQSIGFCTDAIAFNKKSSKFAMAIDNNQILKKYRKY